MLVPRVRGFLSRSKSVHTLFRRQISNEALNERVLVRFDRIEKEADTMYAWYPQYRNRFDEVVAAINKDKSKAYEYEAFVTAIDHILATDEEVLGYKQAYRDKYGEEPKLIHVSFYKQLTFAVVLGLVAAGAWWMYVSVHHRKIRDFKLKYKAFKEEQRREEAEEAARKAAAGGVAMAISEPDDDTPTSDESGTPTLATA